MLLAVLCVIVLVNKSSEINRSLRSDLMLSAHWLFTGEVNVLKSYYDVLPSPSNLFCCGKVESPACHLCSGRGTLDEALDEGRYHWHHGHVLKAIADTIWSGISHCKRLHPMSWREADHSRWDHLFRLTSNDTRLGAKS